jgi:hypothetical protein
MLSVKDYAVRQGITVARVHQLIAEGAIEASKIGSSWILPESELGRRPPVSRPMSPTNAWQFIALISGAQATGDLDPKSRWRLDRKREVLREAPDPVGLLSSWLRKRAPLLALHANTADLSELRNDNRLVLTGISDERSGMASINEVEAYVEGDFAERIIEDYLLVSGEKPNVWLHAASVHKDGNGLAPIGLTIADLADHKGARENQRARELLGHL